MEYARFLRQSGADVVIVDVDVDAVTDAAAEIDAIGVVGDVSKTQTANEAVEAALARSDGWISS